LAEDLYSDLATLGFRNGVIRENKEVFRPIFTAIGDARRHLDPLHYVRITMERIDNSDSDFAVIPDLRFQNEAEFIREWERRTSVPVTLMRVERIGFKRDLPVDAHKSEIDLDRWEDWDVIVNASDGQMDRLESAAVNTANEHMRKHPH